MEEDFTDPRGARMHKSAVKRSLLLVLAIMVIFIALTKILPGQSARTIPQLTGLQDRDAAKPSH
jgi:hypothetical protein